MGYGYRRDITLLQRDLEQYRRLQPHLFPQFESIPDLRRGETRLAAEVALITFQGLLVPKDQLKAFTIARTKALNVFNVLAKG